MRTSSFGFIALAVVLATAAASAGGSADVPPDEHVAFELECSLPGSPDSVSDRTLVVFPFRVPSVSDDRRNAAAARSTAEMPRAPLRSGHAPIFSGSSKTCRPPSRSFLCCYLS